jgi:hypothetical protein
MRFGQWSRTRQRHARRVVEGNKETHSRAQQNTWRSSLECQDRTDMRIEDIKYLSRMAASGG